MAYLGARILIAGVVLSLGGSAIPARASFVFCSQPKAPSAYFTKPTKPYCAASRNCSSWEVSSYRSQVQSYYSDLESYANDVNRFNRDARLFIECMSDLD